MTFVLYRSEQKIFVTQVYSKNRNGLVTLICTKQISIYNLYQHESSIGVENARDRDLHTISILILTFQSVALLY